MNEINSLLKNPRNIYSIMLLVTIPAVLFIMMRGHFLNLPSHYDILLLDEGWTVSRNGEPPESAVLSSYPTGDFARGDSFTLSCTLPSGHRHPSACLYFRNLQCALRVTLDGETIYTYGEERFLENLFIGRLLAYVPLPEGHAGKELTVTLTANEDNAFYGLGPFYYGTEEDLFALFLKERQLAFYIAVFLCMFGVIQLLWVPLLLTRDTSYIKLVFSALTTFVLGTYLMGYYNLFDLFTDAENVNTIIEYISLHMMAFVMAGYISSVVEGRLKTLYRSFLVIDFLFVTVTIMSHLLNIKHITRFLIPCYTLSFLEAAPFIYMIARGWGRHRTDFYDFLEEIADRTIAFGFFCYVLGSFTDAAIFTYVRLSGGQEATVRVPFVTLGSLLYSLAICMHYFLYGLVHQRKESTRMTLMGRAYSDPLTGLSNRSECDLILERLSRERSPFVIISMDLDNLKQVNDTHGHDAGDRMLKGFAEILCATYPDAALIGRMGGDEFVVILSGNDIRQTASLLVDMKRRMAEASFREPDFDYSVSYGVANSTDKKYGRRANDIYMLADERMYDMKRERHSFEINASAEVAHAD